MFCDSFFPVSCVLPVLRLCASYMPKGTLHMAMGTLLVAKGTSPTQLLLCHKIQAGCVIRKMTYFITVAGSHK